MGAVGSPAPEPPVLAGGLQRAEAQVIVQELSRAQGSVPLAARALGLSRATLYRKIKQYGIRLGDRAASAPPPPCEIPVGDLGFSI
jgi:DNA-binding NtrC family response regulator